MNHRGTKTQRRQEDRTTDYTDNTDEGNSGFRYSVPNEVRIKRETIRKAGRQEKSNSFFSCLPAFLIQPFA
jgi:hypothetical protein